ncbi:hypothetical protein G3480_16710 [Thiorhodococcus mannitoliphagus]|uniref:Uncharacterized protein n=1 Tax=Thiorhodococcus mannitoliphagus TaxID=329406 RepID=A0A6P1DYX8_9GAMM|nr:hypothetical protein [Thiorhodococcus mannitoliphagus]NEX21926.1 hypothetical protein [Thiorhodococcus mannitoliphagus]
MQSASLRLRLLLTLTAALAQPALAETVVIGHAGLQPLDRTTVQRIFTGKVVEVKGMRAMPWT